MGMGNKRTHLGLFKHHEFTMNPRANRRNQPQDWSLRGLNAVIPCHLYSLLDGELESQPLRHEEPLGEVERTLDGQRQRRRGDSALNRIMAQVVAAKSGEDRLAESAGADQGPDRGGAHVDDRGRLDAGEDGARGHRQLDPDQPREWRQAQGLGRLAQRRGMSCSPVAVFRTIGSRL